MQVCIARDIYAYVPDSTKFIISHVLLEQEDWFEDEIRFLRYAIIPSMQIVNVGANYGLYTLTLAKRIGSNDRVWAV